MVPSIKNKRNTRQYASEVITPARTRLDRTKQGRRDAHVGVQTRNTCKKGVRHKRQVQECICGYTNAKHRRIVSYVYTTQAPASNTCQTMLRNVRTPAV